MTQRAPVPDMRRMRAAFSLAARGRGRTSPNPSVGCVIVKDGVTVGSGWTRPGGRPHAEAEALDQAKDAAKGADVYVTLEPCAHESARGPACADLLIAAQPARVIAAIGDPDPRTAGKGFARLRGAGIEVVEEFAPALALCEHAGFFVRQREGRPRITLKLAVSIDGRVALESGESQWITGPAARAHAHLMRAESDMVMIGRGTLEADDPSLDVRIAGLEDRSPQPAVVSATLREIPRTAKIAARGAVLLRSAKDLTGQPCNDVLVEGGAGLAGSLIRDDMVDRLLVYRAPIIIGDRAPGIGDIGLTELAAAHGRWSLRTTRRLGADTLEIYARL